MHGRERAAALLRYGAERWMARGLPWRRPEEPLVRRVLVEGLLAQTRADAVADAYDSILGGLCTPQEWFGDGHAERLQAAAALGLPAMKEGALDALARWLATGDSVAKLRQTSGIGPYIWGMVALLMGHEAAPVDTNVKRVAARVESAMSARDWIAEVMAAAMRQDSVLEFPPGYVAMSAVLDVGAVLCTIGGAPRCGECPLRAVGCEFAARGRRQMELL